MTTASEISVSLAGKGETAAAFVLEGGKKEIHLRGIYSYIIILNGDPALFNSEKK